MTEGTVTPATWVEPTRRPVSPGAERWIGQRIAVLDHGYVELLDYMGTDREIVLAARTTTDTEDVKGPAENRRLLRFLVRRRHSTPVEFCRVKVRMQMPVLVARQIIRHRMTSTNEYSLRYSPPIDATYLPELEHVALQATTNRQGRGDALPTDVAARVRELMSAHADASFRLYNELADDLGVARERLTEVLTGAGVLVRATHVRGHGRAGEAPQRAFNHDADRLARRVALEINGQTPREEAVRT